MASEVFFTFLVDTIYDTIIQYRRKRNVEMGYASITIPKQKPIKKIYIELVREIVEQEEKDEKN